MQLFLVDYCFAKLTTVLDYCLYSSLSSVLLAAVATTAMMMMTVVMVIDGSGRSKGASPAMAPHPIVEQLFNYKNTTTQKHN